MADATSTSSYITRPLGPGTNGPPKLNWSLVYQAQVVLVIATFIKHIPEPRGFGDPGKRQDGGCKPEGPASQSHPHWHYLPFEFLFRRHPILEGNRGFLTRKKKVENEGNEVDGLGDRQCGQMSYFRDSSSFYYLFSSEP